MCHRVRRLKPLFFIKAKAAFFYGGKRRFFFYDALRPSDSLSILRQTRGRKFDPTLVLGIVNRCRYGYPRVIVCSPLKVFVPFPTSFWLTCPWLVRLAGTIEAGGGVAELERWIERGALHEWIPFNMDHQRLRIALLSEAAAGFLRHFRPGVFDRLRRPGIGGIRYTVSVLGSLSHDNAHTPPIRVKCIHLQAASWLALRRHPGEAWLEARGMGQDCCGDMRDVCGGR